MNDPNPKYIQPPLWAQTLIEFIVIRVSGRKNQQSMPSQKKEIMPYAYTMPLGNPATALSQLRQLEIAATGRAIHK